MIGARRGSAAGGRPWRWRDVPRLRCDGARALHQSHHLSRRGRLGGADPRLAARSSTAPTGQGRAADRASPRPRRCWSTRAIIVTSWPRRSIEQPEVIGHTLAEYIDFTDRSVVPGMGTGLDLSRLDSAHHHRLRHRVLRGADGEILVRAGCPHPDRGRYRIGVPLPRGASRSQRPRRSSSRSPAKPPTRWPPCVTPGARARPSPGW